MTHFFAMIVPLIFLSSFLFAVYKKVHIYDSFTRGIQQAVPLVLSVFPYVAAVTMLAKLLQLMVSVVQSLKLVLDQQRF